MMAFSDLRAVSLTAKGSSRLLMLALAAGLVPILGLVAVFAFPAQAQARYEMWRGQREVASRSFGAALRHFAAAAIADPFDPLPRSSAAAVYWSAGMAGEAETEWRAALGRDSSDLASLLGLGRSAAAQGRYEEATSLFRTALASKPGPIEARADLASALFGQGDLTGAALEWRTVLATADLDPALRQRGHFQLAVGSMRADPAAALFLLRLAAESPAESVSPSDITSALNAATTIATSAAPAAPSAEPREVAYREALLGYTFLRAGTLGLAQAHFEAAVAAYPGYGDALAYLGNIYWRRGDDTQAALLFHRAGGASPQSALTPYFAGLLFRSQRRFEDAAEALRQAVERDPSNAAMQVELARTFVAKADYASAAEAYERALLLTPVDVTLLNDVASFYLDHLFRIERGLTLSRELARLSPDPAAYDLLGWALHLNGQESSAMVELRRALTLDPTLARAQYHLAVAYDGNGQRDAALAAYRRVVDLDVGSLSTRAKQAIADTSRVR